MTNLPAARPTFTVHDAALHGLLEICGPDAYLVARHMTGEEAGAEAILRETFGTAARELPLLSSHLCVDAWFRHLLAEIALRQTGLSTRPKPARVTTIADAVAALAPVDRLAYLLVELTGVSVDEVADILDEAPATTRRRVHTARVALMPLVPEDDHTTPRRARRGHLVAVV